MSLWCPHCKMQSVELEFHWLTIFFEYSVKNKNGLAAVTGDLASVSSMVLTLQMNTLEDLGVSEYFFSLRDSSHRAFFLN